MAICDVCDKPISEPDGYLLTTRQIVSNPSYWRYMFSHQWSFIKSDPSSANMKAVLATRQANQSNPWLICQVCALNLNANSAEALENAKQWWASRGQFTPSGNGPVPVSVVNMEDSSGIVSETFFPMPSYVYVLGRGFEPKGTQVTTAVMALCEAYDGIQPGLFRGIIALTRQIIAVDRIDFIASISTIKSQYPSAFVADVSVLFQETELDMICVAIWEGLAAQAASRLARRK